MFVLELDEETVVGDDLVGLVLAFGEEFGKSEPLAGHLVAVVGVDKLVVVDAVGGVTLDATTGGLARIEGDDVVEESLA